jgi:hypothetical protein
MCECLIDEQAIAASRNICGIFEVAFRLLQMARSFPDLGEVNGPADERG